MCRYFVVNIAEVFGPPSSSQAVEVLALQAGHERRTDVLALPGWRSELSEACAEAVSRAQRKRSRPSSTLHNAAAGNTCSGVGELHPGCLRGLTLSVVEILGVWDC